MLTEEQINKYYKDALKYFKKEYPNLECKIIDGKFVTKYKWKDSTNLAGSEIEHQVSRFTSVIQILPDGRFITNEVMTDDIDSIGVEGFTKSQSGFSGRIWNYSKEINLGKNNDTEETGVNSYEFCTSEIQEPLKEYFTNLGLKPQFFSYRLAIESLPTAGKALLVALPLLVGTIFLILGIVFAIISLIYNDFFNLVFNPVLLILIIGVFVLFGIAMLVWGIVNIVIIKRKK